MAYALKGLTAISPDGVQSAPAKSLASEQPILPSKSFEEVRTHLSGVAPQSDPLLKGFDLHKDFREISARVVAGKKLDPRDLLILQMKSSELNLQVELFSKAADSLLATARKIQNSQ